MKTIQYTQYGGIDWHDSYEITKQLEEDLSYSIKNPDMVIAKHLYSMITEMQSSTIEEGEKIREVKLQDIPSFDDVLKAVINGEKITLTSPEEQDCYGTACELGFDYLPEDKSVSFYYAYGQVDYHGSYVETEIPDDKVQYLVVENFLAPTKGVPSVQRMYHAPYLIEEEGRKALKELVLHEEYDSCAEILVSNKESDEEDEWYKRNMQLVELMEKHPNVPFRCFTEAHLKEFESERRNNE